MEEHVEKFYRQISKIAQGAVVDLSHVNFMHPLDIGEVCLLLVERQSLPDKKVILPRNQDLLCYLRRMNFHKILSELGYNEAALALDAVDVSEQGNLNVHEVTHSQYVDEFSARLEHFKRMFINFGLNDEDARRALIIVGELGNNVFDHNLGSWPTNFSGVIIVAQNYPQIKRIEVIVGDAGVGFSGSLRNAFPELSSDIEAIKKGLAGYTGRIGEERGNGLQLVQSWTINNFHGILTIRSGKGLVQIDESNSQEQKVPKIVGTLVQFVIYYK